MESQSIDNKILEKLISESNRDSSLEADLMEALVASVVYLPMSPPSGGGTVYKEGDIISPCVLYDDDDALFYPCFTSMDQMSLWSESSSYVAFPIDMWDLLIEAYENSGSILMNHESKDLRLQFTSDNIENILEAFGGDQE